MFDDYFTNRKKKSFELKAKGLSIEIDIAQNAVEWRKSVEIGWDFILSRKIESNENQLFNIIQRIKYQNLISCSASIEQLIFSSKFNKIFHSNRKTNKNLSKIVKFSLFEIWMNFQIKLSKQRYRLAKCFTWKEKIIFWNFSQQLLNVHINNVCCHEMLETQFFMMHFIKLDTWKAEKLKWILQQSEE